MASTDLMPSETPVRFSQGLVDSLQSSPEVGIQYLVENNRI